jgi:hypothetical protein
MDLEEYGSLLLVAIVAFGMWFFWPDRDAPAPASPFTYGARK